MKKVFEIDKELLKQYLDMNMTYSQIAEKFGCSKWTVMERAKEYGMKSNARRAQMLEDNPAAKEEVRKKISDTITNMWENGSYSCRINGMTNKTGVLHPSYVKEGRSSNYRDKAKFYHPEAVCVCCKKQLSWDDKSIEVHHVDEDHGNFSLTNLAPMCHSCHRKYHRAHQPVVQITKSFAFDACHFLPYHDGRCKFLHGHTYHLEVTVKNRVLDETGMVIDFRELKDIVNRNVIDLLDHGFINEHLDYPTCEYMIFWIWRQLSKELKGLHRLKLWETDGSFCELDASTMTWYLKQFESDWTEG